MPPIQYRVPLTASVVRNIGLYRSNASERDTRSATQELIPVSEGEGYSARHGDGTIPEEIDVISFLKEFVAFVSPSQCDLRKKRENIFIRRCNLFLNLNGPIIIIENE